MAHGETEAMKDMEETLEDGVVLVELEDHKESGY